MLADINELENTANDLLFDIGNYRAKGRSEDEIIGLIVECLKQEGKYAYNQALADAKNKIAEMNQP